MTEPRTLRPLLSAKYSPEVATVAEVVRTAQLYSTLLSRLPRSTEAVLAPALRAPSGITTGSLLPSAGVKTSSASRTSPVRLKLTMYLSSAVSPLRA